MQCYTRSDFYYATVLILLNVIMAMAPLVQMVELIDTIMSIPSCLQDQQSKIQVSSSQEGRLKLGGREVDIWKLAGYENFVKFSSTELQHVTPPPKKKGE